MPIAKHLRHLYRSPEFRQARACAVERSGNKCEWCGRPNGIMVERICSGGRMWWRVPSCRWRNWLGKDSLPLPWDGSVKVVLSVCTLAHLDHDPRNNEESNTPFLCQWCHLHYDQGHHRDTRCLRKDGRRPLLGLGA